MHTGPMSDDQGVFGEFTREISGSCPKCGKEQLRYRIWESNCGGYEDYQIKCFSCGKVWWEEGPDA